MEFDELANREIILDESDIKFVKALNKSEHNKGNGVETEKTEATKETVQIPENLKKGIEEGFIMIDNAMYMIRKKDGMAEITPVTISEKDMSVEVGSPEMRELDDLSEEDPETVAREEMTKNIDKIIAEQTKAIESKEERQAKVLRELAIAKSGKETLDQNGDIGIDDATMSEINKSIEDSEKSVKTSEADLENAKKEFEKIVETKRMIFSAIESGKGFAS